MNGRGPRWGRAFLVPIVWLAACNPPSAPGAEASSEPPMARERPGAAARARSEAAAAPDGAGHPQGARADAPGAASHADARFAAEDAVSHRDRAGLPRPFVGMQRSQDTVVELLRQATPTGFKPVGSTSTVFRMTLDAPFAAAFKSATHDRPHGPAAEVAAYRLARCLGLNTVPPAVSRQIPEAALRSAFEGHAGQTWEAISQRLVRQPGDLVPGVAIYWIPEMVDLGLDDPEGMARWTRWLSQGTMLPDRLRSLAAHISTMLVFDYLIGNFDRFSGGNLRVDDDREVVYLRDHDVAFGGRLGARVHRRILSRMLRAERFSRSFYGALLALSRGCFVAELARDPAWQQGELLGEQRIDGVFERLQTARTHIGSLIRLHGRDQVLVFP